MPHCGRAVLLLVPCYLSTDTRLLLYCTSGVPLLEVLSGKLKLKRMAASLGTVA